MARGTARWLRSAASLLSVVAPGIAVCASLWLVRGLPRYTWVLHLETAPWEFWAALVSGVAGTTAGVFDWIYHRWSGVQVTDRERKIELLGLAGGGLSIFGLMAAASVSDRPGPYCFAVVPLFLVTAGLIIYDEIAFHVDRCGPFETRLHRVIVLGNGAAFAAWFHWCFIRVHAL